MTRGIVLAAMTMLFATPAAGQQPPSGQRASEEVLFAEAFAVPTGDSARVRIDLHLRIDLSFFVPVRDPGSGGEAVFTRRGEIMVELRDSLGTSSSRVIRPIELTDDLPERGLEDRAWYETVIPLEAAAGRYGFLIEIDDRESDRKLVDRSRRIDATEIPGPGTSALLFAAGTAPDSVWLQNLGGDVRFGDPSALLVRLPDGDAASVDVVMTIQQAEEDGGTSVSDTLRGLPIETGVALEPLAAGGRVGYRLARGEGEARFSIVPLPTASLPLRRYTLTMTVTHGETDLTLERKFRTLWPQMPLSLRDVEMALQALRYIVTEEVLDSLQDGDFRTRRRNLEEFWRARDRTPATIENEVMTQYYRRVDYARRHFGTIRQVDGFRTDRGRVYVLHGKPTSTVRELDPAAGYREVWTYRHLDKRFVFEDPAKSGNYVLTATEGL